MNNPLVVFLSLLGILTVFLICDYFWIGVINKEAWQKQVSDIQGSPLELNMTAGAFAYIIMSISVLLLVVYPIAISSNNTLNNAPVNNDIINKLKNGALTGLLLGIAMYGTYDATTAAIFSKYDTKMALADFSYGSLVTTFASIVGISISHYAINGL